MAKGAQDWIARTDILLQTLEELVIRNKYGGFNVSDITKVVTASTYTEFFSISGRGIIFNSTNFVWGSGGSQKDDYIRAIVDGETSDSPSGYVMALFGIDLNVHGMPFMRCYDEVNFLYSMQWPAEVTFESSFNGGYIEVAGRTPYVRFGLMYAVI